MITEDQKTAKSSAVPAVPAYKQYKHREGAFSAPWIIQSFIIVNHFLAVYCIFFYHHVSWKLMLFGWFYGWLQELGITAGYHRLWSHHAFSACLPLRIALALIGTTAFQGSIKWWVLRHRVHHRFTDSDVDPYSSARGFWYSHIGWLFEKPRHYGKMTGVDISDLLADPVVRLQTKYIGWGYFIFGLAGPPLVGYFLLDDWLAGLLWVGVIPRIISWNGIWFTNSLSHWWGGREYDDTISARNSFIAAVLCNGEGNHNFHHAFPHDYRHGIKWHEWDPTKWCIWAWHSLGLVGNLRTAVSDSIKSSVLRVSENRARELLKKAHEARARHGWPIEKADLPLMTDEDITRQVEAGRLLIKLDGFVLDVTEFMHEHPGGQKVFLARKGQDASKAYRELNFHTLAAQELTNLFRVGKVAKA